MIYIPIIACISLAVFVLLTEEKFIFGCAILALESESMQPELNKGDLIIIEKVSDYTIDDIVTFHPYEGSEITYTHRIIEQVDTEGLLYFKTKGDNNDQEDPFEVWPRQIQGKVRKTMRSGGKVLLFARSIVGIILLIIIPATALLVLIIRDFLQWLNRVYEKNRVY